MCGLIGFYRWWAEAPEGGLRRMEDLTSHLRHRGPDDQCVTGIGRATFGHRRLRVLDLEGGAQPMQTPDGRFTVAFNGEIYNFRELRSQLEQEGEEFHTSSDTEVLLRWFARKGVDGLGRLRGMFAFAIHDRDSDCLWLARDTMGIKPLYWARTGEGVLFSSELSVMLLDDRVSREVDSERLGFYLAFGYTSGPGTIFHGIRRLSPDQVLRIGPESIEEFPIEEFSIEEELKDAASDPADAERSMEARLKDAVRYRLIADVPIGVLLSGGVDSSLVAALAGLEVGGRLKTFTLGFSDPEFDERPHARRVAAALGAEHHEMQLEPAPCEEVLPSLAWHLGEPFADPSVLPTHYLCELARETVTVALSGEGGDEFFGGYRRYRLEEQDILLRRLAGPLLPALSPLWPRGWRGHEHLELLREPLGRRYAHRLSLFPPEERRALLDQDWLAASAQDPESLLLKAAPPQHGEEPLAWLSRVDQQTYLPDDLLVKADRMSMMHGLEVRVPLLDREVRRLASALPWRVRSGRRGKLLLKRILGRHLDPRLWRRPKRGFSVPLGAWFSDDLGGFCRDVLLSDRCLARPWWSRGYGPHTRKLLERPDRRAGRQIFALLMLELFASEVLDRPALTSGAPRPEQPGVHQP